MATHEIMYVDKEGDVQTVSSQSQQETEDMVTILNRNHAMYTVTNPNTSETVAIAVQ